MAVITGEFVCPECSARLRIQKHGLQTTTIVCPECDTSLQVEQALGGELLVSSGNVTAMEEPLRGLPSSRKSNASIFWGAGLAGGLLVVGFFWWNSSRPPKPQVVPAQSMSAQLPAPVQEQSAPQVAPVDSSKTAPAVSTQTSVFARHLLQLGTRVEQYREDQRAFPPALWEADSQQREQPFSWLAGLDPALESDSSLLPQWNLPWNDPLNDRFVRRKRDDLLNPDVSQPASADRYPASHIVGIAGVGREGPTLPASHARAGIFGYNRSTRVDQVKDGLSNTMLAAGVTKGISSWADGKASIRALTTEPYVNGLDGLGSGQQEGMHVLMADGSVRFVNAKTSPMVLRRMAAMADGLPLDDSIPGEPGETLVAENQPLPPASTALKPSSPEMPVPDSPREEAPEPAPPEPAMQAEMKKGPAQPAINFEKLLAETVLVYQLTNAAPLEEVLVELEALFGVRLEFDAKQIPADDPERRLPVRIDGKNITYRDLLQDALDETPFTFEIREQKLVIVRK